MVQPLSYHFPDSNVYTRQPFPRSEKFAERLTDAAFRNGLILWPNVGHVDGVNGDIVMLAPPFIIAEAQIEEMVRLLEQSLEQVLHG